MIGSMKWALLADLHANRHALSACLQHARAAGATQFAVLGDLVGYGGEPAAVLDIVMELAARGAIVVRGNHDQALPPSPAQLAATGEQASAAWTVSQLSSTHREFLAGLPLAATCGHALLVHADPHEPDRWQYLDRPALVRRALDAAQRGWQLRRVFCGHVHEQHLYYEGSGGTVMDFVPVPGVAVPLAAHRSWLAVVGSVGQPRDGDPRAMYALLDEDLGRLTFQRIPAARLPESFARRLEQGR
jgi:predicted phosphodiesterase